MEKKQLRFKLASRLLWFLQILLAVTFLWAAYAKLFMPAEDLNKMWPWTAENKALVTLAGVSDALAGIGILLPRLLKIWPVLTLYACYGIILLMAAAILFHITRGEVSQLGINYLIILMAAAIIFIWKYLVRFRSV